MNYRSPASSWGIWWRACFIDAWTRRTCSEFWARGPWKTARRAPYWRVSSSFCQVFLLVLPGVIARVLYPDLDPYDRAYARLVHGLLPPKGCVAWLSLGWSLPLLSHPYLNSFLHLSSSLIRGVGFRGRRHGGSQLGHPSGRDGKGSRTCVRLAVRTLKRNKRPSYVGRLASRRCTILVVGFPMIGIMALLPPGLGAKKVVSFRKRECVPCRSRQSSLATLAL